MFKPQLTLVPHRTITVPDSSATIKMKYIKPGVMKNLTSASMAVSSKQTSSGMQAEIGFDTAKKERDIVNACVIGWTGFKDADDNNMKFTSTNLAKMVDESDEFVDWVCEEHDKIIAEVEGAEEEAEKN